MLSSWLNTQEKKGVVPLLGTPEARVDQYQTLRRS
jgi:hypothetical protein